MVECRGWKQNLNKQSAVHHGELPARRTRGSSRSDIQPQRGGGRGTGGPGGPRTRHRVLSPAGHRPHRSEGAGILTSRNPGQASSLLTILLQHPSFLTPATKPPGPGTTPVALASVPGAAWHGRTPRRPDTATPRSPRGNTQLSAFNPDVTFSPAPHTALLPEPRG